MAPIRVCVLDDYQNVALSMADWSPLKDSAVIDVFNDTILDEDLLVQRLESYEVICAMRERTKFTASLLDKLPKLRLLSTTGMKNRGIDVDHAKSKDIVVVGTRGGGNSTLEHIWALIMATARHIVIDDANVKAGNPQWQTEIPLGLSGRTLGLVGVGNLGTKTCEFAKMFNMRVIGWSPNLTPERAAAAGVECVSKEALMRESDIVSIHMVLSEKTHHLIGAADLSQMKPAAYLVNTSRGPIVDEDALIQVLKERRIAGAGLDVFDVEPLPLSHALRTLKNVTVTPHTGYVNDSNYAVFFRDTVENILDYIQGSPKRVL